MHTCKWADNKPQKLNYINVIAFVVTKISEIVWNVQICIENLSLSRPPCQTRVGTIHNGGQLMHEHPLYSVLLVSATPPCIYSPSYSHCMTPVEPIGEMWVFASIITLQVFNMMAFKGLILFIISIDVYGLPIHLGWHSHQSMKQQCGWTRQASTYWHWPYLQQSKINVIIIIIYYYYYYYYYCYYY